MRLTFILIASLNFAIAVAMAALLVIHRRTGWFYDPSFALFGAFAITWLLAVLTGVAYGLVHEDLVARRRGRGIYCRTCRYCLEGLQEPRCPECGQPFDPTDPKTISRYVKSRNRWLVPLLTAWLISVLLLVCSGLALR